MSFGQEIPYGRLHEFKDFIIPQLRIPSFQSDTLNCCSGFLSVALSREACKGRSLMGDKSPKATNKQAAQKQAKSNSNTQKKNSANAAKQVARGKK